MCTERLLVARKNESEELKETEIQIRTNPENHFRQQSKIKQGK